MAFVPTAQEERDTIFRQAEKVGHIGAWSSEVGYGTEKLIWSDETYRIFGLTPDSFHETVAEWVALVHPEDRDGVLKASRAAFEHGIPYSIDHRIVRPDGTIRWVHEQAEIVRDQSGKPLRMVGVVQDITERKTIEEAVRETEARYREVYENSADPIVIADVLEKGAIRMTDINPAGQKLFHISKEQLIGRLPEDLFPPEDAAKINARYRQCSQEGRALTFEDSIHLSDGEHFLYVTLLPIKDARGRISRIMSISHEITEYKKAQLSTSREKRFAETIINSLPGVFMMIDMNHRFVDWNRALEEITGKSRDVLAGTPPKDLISPEDLPTLQNLREQAIADGSSSGELRIMTPSGPRPFLMQTRRATLDGADYLLVFGADITDFRGTQEALRREREYTTYIVDSAPMLIVQLSLDGTIISVNPAVTKTLGYSRKELIGNNWWDLFYPGTLRGQVDQILKDLQDRLLINWEMTISTKEGQQRQVAWTSLSQRDAGGKLMNIIAVGVDRTERKKAEEAQQRLIAIIENTPDYIATFTAENTANYLNDSFKRILPQRYQQFVDEPWKIPVSVFYSPEGYKTLVEISIPYAIKHGTWQGENRLLDARGQEFSVLQTVIAHTGDDGRLLYFSTVARDISAIKEAQDRIIGFNRAYAFLSQVNETIVREQDGDALLKRMCSVATEFGGLPFVWIGKVGEDGAIKPFCHSGKGTVLEQLMVSDLLAGKGEIVENDIARVSSKQRWHQAALDDGLRSWVCFPMHRQGRVAIVVGMYANEPGFFTAEEMAILHEVRADMEFGLQAADTRAEKEAAERRVALSEARFRSMIEQAPYFIQIFDPSGESIYVNPAWVKFWETTPDQVVGYNVLTDPQAESKGITKLIREAFAGTPVDVPPFTYDPALIGKKGRARWVHSYFYPIKDASGTVTEVVHVAEDLTSQIEAGESAKASSERSEQAQARTREVELLNKAMVGREMRIVELKAEVQRLSAELEACKKQ